VAGDDPVAYKVSGIAVRPHVSSRHGRTAIRTRASIEYLSGSAFCALAHRDLAAANAASAVPLSEYFISLGSTV
jgi:hypothetical protein